MIKIQKFVFGPVEENTYIIYNEDGEAAIIDCGAYFPYEEESISSFIMKNNLNLTMMLNTHMHFDHFWGNKFIYDKYNTKCFAPHKDIMGLPSLRKQVERFMPIGDEDIELSIDIYNDIKQNDIIKLGKDEIKVLEVPGHSPGHVVFYIEKDKILFSGDTIFLESIGRTDLWGGNLELLQAKIREELFTLGDDVIVYPGHGVETSIAHEKRHNPFL